ncbi:unnamed protein product [Microthlaspi erraticum]|uniref:Uncharacterized protein n=1 Tax=Microthlaspi erraticum TaxID=1685480 RepID=A0A6D2JFL4_9BRAS|nr:unnamed protein product [Microthlaspi erraticum]
MPPNLRAVVAQCNRLGGRSNGCRQTRNFSSTPELEGMGRRLVAKWMRTSVFPWAAIGFMGFSGWEAVGLIRYYLKAKVTLEEFELRKQRHKEVVAKAGREIDEILAKRRGKMN